MIIWQGLENCLGQAWLLYTLSAAIHFSHQKEMRGMKLLVCHASYYVPMAWLLRLRWRIAMLMSAFFRYTSVLKTRWILVIFKGGFSTDTTQEKKNQNLARPRTAKIRISILSCNRKMLITHVAFAAMMETDSTESWNT